MEIKNLIEAALSVNAHEILIEPNGRPRCRRDRDWMFFATAPLDVEISSSVTRKWAFEILPESGRQKLLEKRAVRGFWDISGQKLYYELVNTEAGFLINLQWMPQDWKSTTFWQWPAWIGESMSNGAGLGLVLSPSLVAREAAIESLIRLSDQGRSLWTAWMRPNGFMNNGLESGLMTFLASAQDSAQETLTVPSSCDIVVIDDPSQIETALNLSQEGKFVIFSCAGTRIEAFLQSRVPATKVELFWSQLKWGLNLRTVWGRESWLPVYDLIFNSESLRSRWIGQGGQTNKTLEEILLDSDRELGMRTINQTLIQGLMRRQLDFKRSFELSPEPERLDEKLKTLGF